MVRWALANAAVTGPAERHRAESGDESGIRANAWSRAPAAGDLPAPAFALRLRLGEMADVVLSGQRVLPAKAQSLGFDFRYPVLEGTRAFARDLRARSRQGKVKGQDPDPRFRYP